MGRIFAGKRWGWRCECRGERRSCRAKDYSGVGEVGDADRARGRRRKVLRASGSL